MSKRAILIIATLSLATIGLGVFLLFQEIRPVGEGLSADLSPDHNAAGIYVRGPSRGGAVPETLWASPGITGVFMLFDWSKVQLSSGLDDNSFDFTLLDQELNEAAKHNKFVTLSFAAGKHGTPEWLFTDTGVKGYDFRDHASQAIAEGQCGSEMTLASPTDPAYQAAYFSLIRAVGEHISKNPDWLARVKYVKLNGANLFTHEIRLPKRCDPGCLCNTRVWAEAGYTPSGMREFLLEQAAVWREAFPNAVVIYPLIQDGLPWLNDDGDYLTADNASSGGELEKSVDQVKEIIASLQGDFGESVMISHNGLKANHEPNKFVINAGKNGLPTGFQTVHPEALSDLAGLQATLENFWLNSSANYLEIYVETATLVLENQGRTAPAGENGVPSTLEGWNELIKTR